MTGKKEPQKYHRCEVEQYGSSEFINIKFLIYVKGVLISSILLKLLKKKKKKKKNKKKKKKMKKKK